MKGQAIQAISKTLRNQETPHVDGNIGAVLCMAVVAPLDWDPYNVSRLLYVSMQSLALHALLAQN